MPLLNISGPLVSNTVKNFGRKLFLALYYKHANEILPKTSGIALRYFSNLKIENGALPQELANYLSNLPELKRCNTNLHDQFFYRYVFLDTGNLSVFVAFFRQSFAILGVINKCSAEFELPEGSTIFAPFIHQ